MFSCGIGVHSFFHCVIRCAVDVDRVLLVCAKLFFAAGATALVKATPHDPCASVCAASTGVEAQIFVRLPKFDAGLRAKCASLCATSRRIDVIFDDVGDHDG